MLKDEHALRRLVRNDAVAHARDCGAMTGMAVGGIHEAASLEWPSTPRTRVHGRAAGSALHAVTLGTKTDRTSPQRQGR
jgi:hypothetical protein